ncbi:MAG TPA: adenylate/guanylate cyclase domain-containing protein [Micromonosporaceae bacterium]
MSACWHLGRAVPACHDVWRPTCSPTPSGEDAIQATCANCGRTAGPDDRYCGGCGTSLRFICVRCGRTNAADSAFCTGCGRPRAEPAPVSREDRRRVSILFIDVVGFTRYAENADPERVRALQNDYFTAVRSVVHQYGGVVEKYIGDAVMALFGAPIATENDALRCVRAGLELQRTLPRRDRIQAAKLRFRVGIATGEALVDLTAAHDGGQAIVAGDVVTTAARLQGVAPAGGVYVCATTHSATRDDIEYAEQPAVTLRGRSTPNRVWLAVAPRRPAHEPDSEPTPMIDREHERTLLVSTLERTIRDRVPQLVTVFGAAGIGKSRLLRELARYAARIDEPKVCWRVGHCPPFGENVTFAALADVVKAEAGILDSDDETTAGQRLADALTDLAGPEEGARLVDALGPLVGLPGSKLAPGEVELAWRRFVLALAARQPTVLIFEDLHWADEAMLRFVEMLGTSARGLPLMVIATARPELRDRYPRWTSTITGTVSISLPPMRDAHIRTLYSSMLGSAQVSPATLAPLVELAGGNPLYAHEYVRMLVEGGMLRTVGPQWTLDIGEGRPIPDNVHAVIANRLDLLDPDDRAVLQAAAVVGTQFWPGAVAAAVAQPVEAVQWALRRMERRDLIQEQPTSTMAGQSEYRFRHILVRDVCYQRLPRAERVGRHQRTADWLEAVSDGRQSDLAEVLAHHRWASHEITRTLGGDPSPYAPAARAAMHRAARRAYALHALQTAATWVDRARGLDLGEDLSLELFAAELALYRDGDAFLRDGGDARLTSLAERLFAAGDRAGAARAWTLLGTAAWCRADRAATLRCLDRAVELYADLPDTEEKASALLELARVHMLNYENTPAIVAAEAAVDMADRLGLVEVRANAQITLVTARYIAGDPNAFEALTEITDYCRRLHLSSRRRAVHNLAWALLEEGDVAGCNRLIDEQRTVDVADGHSLATSFADESARAFFAGDWQASIAAATASMRRPTAEWDLHVVAQSAWLRVLRGEPVDSADLVDTVDLVDGTDGDDGTDTAAAGTGEDAVDRAVAAARRGGFHRVLRSTLAHAALCRVLQDRHDEAARLLAELDADWSGAPILPFGEWVAAAAQAAALTGRAWAARVRDMVTRSPRHTPWVDAASATLDGALTGDADAYLRAAAIYERIGNHSDRMLCLAAAARALVARGRLDRARSVVRDLSRLARPNGAVRLFDGLPATVVPPSNGTNAVPPSNGTSALPPSDGDGRENAPNERPLPAAAERGATVAPRRSPGAESRPVVTRPSPARRASAAPPSPARP